MGRISIVNDASLTVTLSLRAQCERALRDHPESDRANVMCEPKLLGRVTKRNEVCIENIFRILHESQTVLKDKTST